MEVYRLCNRGIIIRDGQAIKLLEKKDLDGGPEALHKMYLAAVGGGAGHE
jgi:hypothetical protein